MFQNIGIVSLGARSPNKKTHRVSCLLSHVACTQSLILHCSGHVFWLFFPFFNQSRDLRLSLKPVSFLSFPCSSSSLCSFFCFSCMTTFPLLDYKLLPLAAFSRYALYDLRYLLKLSTSVFIQYSAPVEYEPLSAFSKYTLDKADHAWSSRSLLCSHIIVSLYLFKSILPGL